jgi:hypothetical protein
MRKLMFAVMFVVAALVVGCDDYNAPSSLRTAFYDRYPTAVDVE